jgi:hypothetical protein
MVRVILIFFPSRPESVDPAASSESFGIQPVNVCWGVHAAKIKKGISLMASKDCYNRPFDGRILANVLGRLSVRNESGSLGSAGYRKPAKLRRGRPAS